MNSRFILVCALLASLHTIQAAWKPQPGPLLTRWAADVSPKKPLNEYPRPQLVRDDWENLNGLWDYAITEQSAGRPTQWAGQILVPFPVQSALSGVMTNVTEKERLWYRRTFGVPRGWRERRVLLHFGAVDWDATVWVNGKEIGKHQGGYDSFQFDITDALRARGDNELVVSVWDPTDAGPQPRGKQVRKPEGIWYTPVSGIWQTVWLEPVAGIHLERLKMTPALDDQTVTVQTALTVPQGEAEVTVTVLDGGKKVAEAKSQHANNSPGAAVMTSSPTLKVPTPKLWSPERPFLYELKVTVRSKGKVVDEVESYFAMRKISMARDGQGRLRMQLNNTNYFQLGPLDQGWWPDGLYTAPTDEALRYDLEVTKKLGFNMARKHVKVEPARWYYWADKLGLLVWQDMPSGDKSARWRGPSGYDGEEMKRTTESAAIYEREWKAIIEQLYNHPSIVVWVPFNEGWGQFDTVRILNLTKQLDPTRLVDGASGGNHFPAGDIIDHHQYPGPGAPAPVTDRAMVLGEFGGLGLPLKGHTWQNDKNWGYRSFTNAETLTENYVALLKKLHPMIEESGLSAAIYTQTTDVEVEINGLMTYDRAVTKMPVAVVAAANSAVYKPFQPRRAEAGKLNPPAVPLVAVDPYFSIWSQGDKLTDVDTTHWTGKAHRLTSLVRIDGKAFRVMGASPATVPALEQKSVNVLPTRTIYVLEGAGVELTLTFMTPALPDDLDVLSWPVTYVTYDFKAKDGRTHEVAVQFQASAEIAVNTGNQEVWHSLATVPDLEVVKVGSVEQAILAKTGDDLRIDWGHFYVASPKALKPSGMTTSSDPNLPFSVRPPIGGSGNSFWTSFDFQPVKLGKAPVSRWLMLAYDDLYSIQYMKQNLRPYWRRTGWEAADLLKAAARDYESLKKRCAVFDEELMADLRRAGGENYALLGALAYRQCFAAGKFVADANGKPISFCKENHSNGCIGTSDVFYPMAPQFLLFGPTLAKSFLVPFMNYAASDRWKFPFAPHDLGTYPKANGQVYGDGERGVNNQMPVEESGNLLILFGAVAQMEGNADFAGLYWKQLEQWAQFLKEKGFDPENQLCTDDFAGHLAHNVNLSAKAICGLGAFAKLCEMRAADELRQATQDRFRDASIRRRINDLKHAAADYRATATNFAARWVKEADDGDHFRLAFDKPGSWSQKYNLAWDRILGLNLFPDSVLRKEMDYYKKTQNKYGLPLDNRKDYTKLDWITWTATLTQDRKDFEALVDPILTFLNETPDHSPMTDWYQTKTARKVGFTARPVVGGVFLQMLYDKPTWAKYASRDKTKASGWAPMPKPPVLKPVVATSQESGLTWRYTTQKPTDDWFKASFDDSSWKTGPGGFGTRNTPGAVVRTVWNTPSIWLRREFELPTGDWKNLSLIAHHDEDVEIYINGVMAAKVGGFTSDYEELTLNAVGKAAIKPGKNTLAVRCRQTQGGQYVDVGLVELVPAGK